MLDKRRIRFGEFQCKSHLDPFMDKKPILFFRRERGCCLPLYVIGYVLWNRSEAILQDRRSITTSHAKRSPFIG
ncbi:MAG: hypothetical protein ACI81W_002583 [Saprospiraceae bacterium]|jgi:hypothetical protein